MFVRSTRVGGGSVTLHSVDAECGTVAANSLNPQKARILLSLALTLTHDSTQVQKLLRSLFRPAVVRGHAP